MNTAENMPVCTVCVVRWKVMKSAQRLVNDTQKNVKLRQVYIQNSRENCRAIVFEQKKIWAHADADLKLIYAHDIWQLKNTL